MRIRTPVRWRVIAVDAPTAPVASGATLGAVPIFAVTYAYAAPDEELAAVRPEHRAFLRGLLDQGVLLASGPWADGVAGALLLLRAVDGDAALAALDPDPFWAAGFIASRDVRGWNPVIGPWA